MRAHREILNRLDDQFNIYSRGRISFDFRLRHGWEICSLNWQSSLLIDSDLKHENGPIENIDEIHQEGESIDSE